MSNFTSKQNLEIIWEALCMYRSNLIPEGNIKFDTTWDNICTAMADITEDLSVLDETD